MGSSTKKLKAVRDRKHQKAGKARKKKSAKASTPAFPIHVPEHEGSEKSE